MTMVNYFKCMSRWVDSWRDHDYGMMKIDFLDYTFQQWICFGWIIYIKLQQRNNILEYKNLHGGIASNDGI